MRRSLKDSEPGRGASVINGCILLCRMNWAQIEKKKKWENIGETKEMERTDHQEKKSPILLTEDPAESPCNPK